MLWFLVVVVVVLAGIVAFMGYKFGMEARRAAEQDQARTYALITKVVNRPPIVVEKEVGTAGVVAAIGEAVSKVQYGPAVEYKEQPGVNPVADLNEKAGMNGQYFPDVEFDEWMNDNGMPNKFGWMPPPTLMMEGSPESGINPVPRHPSDQQQFKSGESGPMPTGGMES